MQTAFTFRVPHTPPLLSPFSHTFWFYSINTVRTHKHRFNTVRTHKHRFNTVLTHKHCFNTVRTLTHGFNTVRTHKHRSNTVRTHMLFKHTIPAYPFRRMINCHYLTDPTQYKSIRTFDEIWKWPDNVDLFFERKSCCLILGCGAIPPLPYTS